MITTIAFSTMNMIIYLVNSDGGRSNDSLYLELR